MNKEILKAINDKQKKHPIRNWEEEIKMGMLLIQSGCQKSSYDNKIQCIECPFAVCCDAILRFANPSPGIPEDWNIEAKGDAEK